MEAPQFYSLLSARAFLLGALLSVLTFSFITFALYARQQKGQTTVPLVYIRVRRFEQFPTSFEHP